MTPAEKPRWCPPNLETSLHQRFLITAKRLHLKGAHLGEELERLWSLEELIWFIKEHWMKWRRGEEETIKQQSLCFKSWHHFQPLWSRGPAESCQGQGGLLSGKSGPWVPRRIFRAWESKRIFSLLELGQNRPRLPGSAALAQNGRVWPFCFLGFVSSQPGWDGKIKTKQTKKKKNLKNQTQNKPKEAWKVFNNSPTLWGPTTPIWAADPAAGEEPAHTKSRKQTKNPSWTHPVPRESNKKWYLPNQPWRQAVYNFSQVGQTSQQSKANHLRKHPVLKSILNIPLWNSQSKAPWIGKEKWN